VRDKTQRSHSTHNTHRCFADGVRQQFSSLLGRVCAQARIDVTDVHELPFDFWHAQLRRHEASLGEHVHSTVAQNLQYPPQSVPDIAAALPVQPSSAANAIGIE
jgi:hypothetical protein